ncbi:hypothetical protein [ANMV-1 virus]|nr:hypothetical protein [ANMV-1 virus]
MGLIIDWLGCTPEAACIEYSLGTLLFFGWFFTMKFLGYYYDRRNEEDNI